MCTGILVSEKINLTDVQMDASVTNYEIIKPIEKSQYTELKILERSTHSLTL